MPEEYRGQCDDIARQLVYSDIGQKVNLVFGGGKQNFVKKSDGGMYFKINEIFCNCDNKDKRILRIKVRGLRPISLHYYPYFFPGKRQDEDLIDVWRKIKEKQGVDFNVLFDKSDLDRWDHSDFALGLFRYHPYIT